MSLQWTLVASFLYTEIGFTVILLLPFISPTRWQKIFKSRLVTRLASYANVYFNIMLVILVILLLEATRGIFLYKTRLNSSNDKHFGGLHYGPTMELVKEFRAQRNFYIAGTALFLWFVLKRLLALISQHAHLIAENKAIKQQAESALKVANSLLDASAPPAPEFGSKEPLNSVSDDSLLTKRHPKIIKDENENIVTDHSHSPIKSKKDN